MKGWLIAFAAMGLNLTLGVIYSWSVFNKVLSKPIAEGGYGWTDSMERLAFCAFHCYLGYTYDSGWSPAR